MTPPRTIIGGVFESPWFRHPWRRRLMLAVAALVFAILAIWPRHYVAEAELLPQDSGGGLSAALAQQGTGGMVSLGALLGDKQPVEADLTIARSHAVLDLIMSSLRAKGERDFDDREKAAIRLHRSLSVIAIRGSILQITVTDKNARRAQAIVGAAAQAIQDRLTAISLFQATQKRAVANNRLKDATVNLARAQAALSQFRTANKLAAPVEQLGTAVGLLANLEARLQAKQVEIATLRQFATASNIKVQAAEAELSALRSQVEAAKVSSRDEGASNLAGIALTNTEYFNLYRDEKSAEILYEVFRKYLEEITVDELSANQNLVLIEPPYVYPERQFNIWAVGLLALVVILGVAAEFYMIRPPIGRRVLDSRHA